MLVLYPIMELMPVVWLHARITHAKTKGITYFRRSNDSFIFPPAVDFVISAVEIPSISASSDRAWSVERERRSAFNAASFLPRWNNHRGDSATRKLPTTNRIPGGKDTQKILRHAASLYANSFAASPSFATSSTRML